MQIWTLLHGKDGYEVELTETPWWALAVSRAIEVVDVALGCRLCGANSPDWVWRLPLGRPVYDADVVAEGEQPFLVNSLGGALYNLFSQVGCADIRFRRSLHRFAVTAELAQVLGAELQVEDEESS